MSPSAAFRFRRSIYGFVMLVAAAALVVSCSGDRVVSPEPGGPLMSTDVRASRDSTLLLFATHGRSAAREEERLSSSTPRC